MSLSEIKTTIQMRKRKEGMVGLGSRAGKGRGGKKKGKAVGVLITRRKKRGGVMLRRPPQESRSVGGEKKGRSPAWDRGEEKEESKRGQRGAHRPAQKGKKKKKKTRPFVASWRSRGGGKGGNYRPTKKGKTLLNPG